MSIHFFATSQSFTGTWGSLWHEKQNSAPQLHFTLTGLVGSCSTAMAHSQSTPMQGRNLALFSKNDRRKNVSNFFSSSSLRNFRIMDSGTLAGHIGHRVLTTESPSFTLLVTHPDQHSSQKSCAHPTVVKASPGKSSKQIPHPRVPPDDIAASLFSRLVFASINPDVSRTFLVSSNHAVAAASKSYEK